MRYQNRKSGGFVLLVVLALLVVLTVVASIAYSRASDQVVMSTALKRQAIAQDRAVMALHQGVAQVQQTPRPPSLATLGSIPPCPNADPATCIGTAFDVIPPVVVEGPQLPGADLDNGGGSQYTIHFIRWKTVAMPGAVSVVHAIGYHGLDPVKVAGSTRMSSEVLVEVSEGTPNSGGCVGYCGSGL
jgi:hypothetical protein